ncbi:MAG: sulfate adenylyltransferase subunit CysN [Hahellaceae bacterium]|nr:sulfate adenylyltransferase subunit CysN [Hahellaceae bacterium]
MAHQSDLIGQDILAYLKQHENKELLRLLTCGSVDDGKSTLIGRLLHDSKMIYEDQLEAVRRDSSKMGNAGEKIDFSLLVDGLQAEREQGITIDVAYRFFSTDKRKFIIADTPGHEQYTRNMVTGASTAQLAIILIDARYGVLKQTKRHTYLASLLGIKHLVVAINKMDIVDYSQETFEKIKADYKTFAKSLNVKDVRFVPISALDGDNVVANSPNMPWYQDQPLMSILETVEIAKDVNLNDFRLHVQFVNRPNLDFRGFSGTIASGIVRPGDAIMALPSRKTSHVKSIVTYDGELSEAWAGQAVTLTLTDEIDVSRGDMLVKTDNVPPVSNRFEATVVWMTEQAMTPGRQYYIKQGCSLASATISKVLYKTDVNTLERSSGESELHLNEIGLCQLTLNQPLAFDPYSRNPLTGSFILIDRITNVTIAAGMIEKPVEETESVSFDALTAEERRARFGHAAGVISVTGAQAERLANGLERALFERGQMVAQSGNAPETAIEALKAAGLLVLVKDYPADKALLNAHADTEDELATQLARAIGEVKKHLLG